MATYRCARELEGEDLHIGDLIIFSDVGEFKVRHTSVGWYLNGEHAANNAVFTYLYGIKESPYDCIKKFGNYPTRDGGIFPYLKTVGALTEVVGNLFLEIERKRLKEFSFKIYTPKGSIAVLSKENIFKLCKNQVEQGNIFDIRVFENYWPVNRGSGGMTWTTSIEGEAYWNAVFNSVYPLNVPSTVSDTSLKGTETKPFDGRKINLNTSSLATLSVKRAQKPKLKTL